MPERLTKIIYDTANAAQEKNRVYHETYQAYVKALEIAMAALIQMVKANGTGESVQHYDRAMASLIVMREAADNAQAERVNTISMYEQIVDLVARELVDIVNQHTEAIRHLEERTNAQQRYINEMRDELTRSSLP